MIEHVCQHYADPLTLADAEEIADEIADRLDFDALGDIEVSIDGSLFSVNQDFIDLLAKALNQVDFLEIDQLGDVESLIDDVEAFLEEVDPDNLPTTEDLPGIVSDALTDALEDLPGASLLTDPETFLEDTVEPFLDSRIGEETLDDIQDTLDQYPEE